MSRTLLTVMTIVVGTAVIAGFAVVGSPTTQRGRRMDEKRVEDLSNIQREVLNYRYEHDELPTALDQLGDVSAHDPLTAQPYEYVLLEGKRFELCAIFQQPSTHRSGSWHHDAGRKCFARTAAEKAWHVR